MKISMWVPSDEKRLRRTLRFLLRPQLKIVRILGGVLIVLGLALLAVEPSMIVGYVAVLLGLLVGVAIAPIMVAWSVRMQSKVIKDGCHMTLDDEGVTVAHPLVESRFRWAALDRIIETPDVWYAMFGKIQAVAIPKDPMTEEQRAEFAVFVAGLQPDWK